ncbi:chemotaxis protein CheW [Chamaesiphon polymorphus]|uniref:Chemotaxis protein CheW n=1 Tax=Chamaesiphon polymorphus CCALA 037 TaxID=2107692 RepID=A0A2T1GJD0_9CYAN|nr:chemotaxis protein CheW [Chamaesiphon polymorphus]PSB57780.1 chemotaxis protein CheW [Chamaesiphon polymorphus CCALA 037]
MSKLIERTSPFPNGKQMLAHQATADTENQRFLGFTIGDNLNALIPLIDLQATIKILLTEILPVPQMHESLLGIINYGGKATWVLDLAHLMGGNGYLKTPEMTTGMGMLFQIHNETVALLIDRVGTIETYNVQQCLPLGETMFTERMRLFLSGYFIDDKQQSRVIIDLQQIIRAIA